MEGEGHGATGEPFCIEKDDPEIEVGGNQKFQIKLGFSSQSQLMILLYYPHHIY